MGTQINDQAALFDAPRDQRQAPLFGGLYMTPGELDGRAAELDDQAAAALTELDGQGILIPGPKFKRGDHVTFSLGSGRVTGVNPAGEVAIEQNGRTFLRHEDEVSHGPAAVDPPRCAVCARRDHKPGTDAGHPYRDPADRQRRGEQRFPAGSLVQVMGGPREFIGALGIVESVESPTMRVVQFGRDRQHTGSARIGIRGLRLHAGKGSAL